MRMEMFDENFQNYNITTIVFNMENKYLFNNLIT